MAGQRTEGDGTVSHSARGFRVLGLGVLAAALSAVGCLYYFVSLVLSPLWLVNWFFALRVRNRLVRSKSATYGLALAIGALLMPFVGLASFMIYGKSGLGVYPNGSIRTGAPFYTAVYTPVAAALVIPLVVAWLSLTFRPPKRRDRLAA